MKIKNTYRILKIFLKAYWGSYKIAVMVVRPFAVVWLPLMQFFFTVNPCPVFGMKFLTPESTVYNMEPIASEFGTIHVTPDT